MQKAILCLKDKNQLTDNVGLTQADPKCTKFMASKFAKNITTKKKALQQSQIIHKNNLHPLCILMSILPIIDSWCVQKVIQSHQLGDFQVSFDFVHCPPTGGPALEGRSLRVEQHHR